MNTWMITLTVSVPAINTVKIAVKIVVALAVKPQYLDRKMGNRS